MKKTISINGKNIDFDLVDKNEQSVNFEFNGKAYHFELVKGADGRKYLSNDGKQQLLVKEKFSDGVSHLFVGEVEAQVQWPKSTKSKASVKEGSLRSPMPGKIIKVNVALGDKVKAGQVLVVMEAMKMEHSIKAPKNGVVEELFYAEGDLIQGGADVLALKVEE